MKTKTSKTEQLISDTKERLSAELLKLPQNKRVAYIIKEAKPVIDALKKKRKSSKAMIGG